jgi:hypothetical protein
MLQVSYLHVQDDITAAAVNPVPIDRLATGVSITPQKGLACELFGIFDVTTLSKNGGDPNHSQGKKSTKADHDTVPSALAEGGYYNNVRHCNHNELVFVSNSERDGSSDDIYPLASLTRALQIWRAL